MTNNQESGTDNLVQTFYLKIYDKFNRLIEESDEDFGADNFFSYYNKYFKNFVENGSFVEKEGPYLEFHTEKEEDFVFINKYIKEVQVNFKDCKMLAEEMGYDYKMYSSKFDNANKTGKLWGFRIPYADFERKIIMCAFEELNRSVNNLEKENEDLKKGKEDSEKKISSIKNENKNIKKDMIKYKKTTNNLEGENKYLKGENERLIEENNKLKGSEYSYKIKIEEANKDRSKKKILINTLVKKIKKESSEFDKFKKNYGVVIYNVWRMGRTIKKDHNFNKQNFESITNLIDIFGKNLENSGSGFEDERGDLEFLENQQTLINGSLKSLEKSYKQYKRISILLEKSGIRIEEYDDIKNEDKLNVTVLDVVESSEVQEIIVETVKPSIYYAEKRIFEGEVIITKPK